MLLKYSCLFPIFIGIFIVLDVWNSSVNKTKSLLLFQGETNINNLEKYILFYFLFIYFLAVPSGTRALNSLTRDQIHAPCSGSTES